MSVRAYILIHTEVGKAVDVTDNLGHIDGITSADDVTGPYDVIAVGEAPSLDDLGKMVVTRVQLIDGITRTLTCPVINLSQPRPAATLFRRSSPDSRSPPWRRSGRRRRRR